MIVKINEDILFYEFKSNAGDNLKDDLSILCKIK